MVVLYLSYSGNLWNKFGLKVLRRKVYMECSLFHELDNIWLWSRHDHNFYTNSTLSPIREEWIFPKNVIGQKLILYCGYSEKTWWSNVTAVVALMKDVLTSSFVVFFIMVIDN